ncbi:MAG: stage 0 sporulation family protein [Deltaproteobacteria bacterium]|nr:stage 0 sporulation family protein [Deltaproteobacteria bacterium]
MSKIVGIKLGKSGKIYDFDSGHFVLKPGDRVIVNTEQGKAMGVICNKPRAQEEELKPQSRELKQVYRIANNKDIEKYEKNCRLENDIYSYCYDSIKRLSLDMSLIAVERMFDGSKVVIYFSSEGRVDFRELIKELVQQFHTKIEMKQIGVRHQAKMVGGLGTCGRPLCCSTFLDNFAPVSIKMAKKQNLSLNPAKISGMCGRLMCCLAYEYDYYNEAQKNIPKVGKMIDTKKGRGKIIRHNVLRETFTICLDPSEEEVEISYGEIINDSAPKENNKRGGNQ